MRPLDAAYRSPFSKLKSDQLHRMRRWTSSTNAGVLLCVIALSLTSWLSRGLRSTCPKSACKVPSISSKSRPQSIHTIKNAAGAVLLAAVEASCAKFSSLVTGTQDESAVGNVSVVIGAYNRSLSTSLIISALARQRKMNLDIVLVDAGTQPPLLVQYPHFSEVVSTFVYHAYDQTYHRVRNFNEGVALAKYDVIVLLDDDVIPANEFWAYGVHHAFATDPSLSVVRMPMVIKEFRSDLSDVLRRDEEIRSIQDWTTSYPPFTSCNVAFSRSAWRTLFGFAAVFDGKYGGEDEDIHRRARAAGMKYGKAPPYSCALHVGLFYGNRGINNRGSGYDSRLKEPEPH